MGTRRDEKSGPVFLCASHSTLVNSVLKVDTLSINIPVVLVIACTTTTCYDKWLHQIDGKKRVNSVPFLYIVVGCGVVDGWDTTSGPRSPSSMRPEPRKGNRWGAKRGYPGVVDQTPVYPPAGLVADFETFFWSGCDFGRLDGKTPWRACGSDWQRLGLSGFF